VGTGSVSHRGKRSLRYRETLSEDLALSWRVGEPTRRLMTASEGENHDLDKTLCGGDGPIEGVAATRKPLSRLHCEMTCQEIFLPQKS
jgi:hypothetical protein